LKKSGREVVDRGTSYAYGTMALTSEGDPGVGERKTRPTFGL
jgi:hypothetical protein